MRGKIPFGLFDNVVTVFFTRCEAVKVNAPCMAGVRIGGRHVIPEDFSSLYESSI